MDKKRFSVKDILNNFELYLGTLCFIILTIMLTLQVASRYILHNAFTWMEEFATIMFVWMIYFGVSAAVTTRKHLRIDFVLDMVPFKTKRAMLLASNVVFAFFNAYLSYVLFDIMSYMGTSKTTMLHWPQYTVYAIIPLGLLLSIIRLVQDSKRLMGEDEKSLGGSKPSMDLDACEEIYRQKVARGEKEAAR